MYAHKHDRRGSDPREARDLLLAFLDRARARPGRASDAVSRLAELVGHDSDSTASNATRGAGRRAARHRQDRLCRTAILDKPGLLDEAEWEMIRRPPRGRRGAS